MKYWQAIRGIDLHHDGHDVVQIVRIEGILEDVVLDLLFHPEGQLPQREPLLQPFDAGTPHHGGTDRDRWMDNGWIQIGHCRI